MSCHGCGAPLAELADVASHGTMSGLEELGLRDVSTVGDALGSLGSVGVPRTYPELMAKCKCAWSASSNDMKAFAAFDRVRSVWVM